MIKIKFKYFFEFETFNEEKIYELFLFMFIQNLKHTLWLVCFILILKYHVWFYILYHYLIYIYSKNYHVWEIEF
jgi:hypothetical protein